MLSYIKWSEQLRINISLIWCKSRHYLAFHIRRAVAVLMNYQKFQFGNTACSFILDKSSILYYERSDLSPESKSQCTSCSLTLTTSRDSSRRSCLRLRVFWPYSLKISQLNQLRIKLEKVNLARCRYFLWCLKSCEVNF